MIELLGNWFYLLAFKKNALQRDSLANPFGRHQALEGESCTARSVTFVIASLCRSCHRNPHVAPRSSASCVQMCAAGNRRLLSLSRGVFTPGPKQWKNPAKAGGGLCGVICGQFPDALCTAATAHCIADLLVRQPRARSGRKPDGYGPYFWSQLEHAERHTNQAAGRVESVVPKS